MHTSNWEEIFCMGCRFYNIWAQLQNQNNLAPHISNTKDIPNIIFKLTKSNGWITCELTSLLWDDL